MIFPDKFIFDEAQSYIFKLMESDSFKRFKLAVQQL